MSLSKDFKAQESSLEKRLAKLEADGNHPFRVLAERDAFYAISSMSLSLTEEGLVHLAVHADSHEPMAKASPFYEEDYEAEILAPLLLKLIENVKAKDLARADEYTEWTERMVRWFEAPKTSLSLRVRVRPNAFSAAAAKLRQ